MNDNVFLAALKKFEDGIGRLEKKESNLLAHRTVLIDNLNSISFTGALNEAHPLAKQSQALKANLDEKIASWIDRWEQTSPMRDFSNRYADRVILLVFGKVNAGKSSFCNFMTNLFPSQDVKRFYLKGGKQVEVNGSFKEGITETTASIQGIELGRYLLLLDTPGLHSVTDANAALTRKFTDSGDAILWLTSSTSPGQVQELIDLKDELKKQKPLQPVITRSDYTEEDIDDENQIIKKLLNKSVSNRNLQEKDVFQRVDESLQEEAMPTSQLKQPLSISVHAYQQSKKTSEDENAAGLEALYSSLAEILNEARVYKVKKVEQQMLNHLEGDILSSLSKNIVPFIDEIAQTTADTITGLEIQKEKIIGLLTYGLCAVIPQIIDEHKENKPAIAKALNARIETEVGAALQQALQGYIDNITHIACELSPNQLGEFKDITIDISKRHGAWKKSAATSGAAVAGAVAGSFIPVVGTLIGGLLGGLLGGAAGSAVGDELIEHEILKQKVGVSSVDVIAQTTASVEKHLPRMVTQAVDKVIELIAVTQQSSVEVRQVIAEFEQSVMALKSE